MNKFSTFINKDSFFHKLNPSLKLISGLFIIIIIFLPIGFLGHLFTLIIILGLWISAKLPWRTMRGILKSVTVMFCILFLINWIAFKSPGFVADISRVNYLFNYNDYSMIGNLIINVNGGSSNLVFIHGMIWGGEIYTNSVFTSIQHGFQWEGWKYISEKINNQTFYLYYMDSWYSLSSEVISNTLYVTLKIFSMITIITLIISTTTSVQLTFAIEDILSPLKYLKVPVNEWSMTISIAIRFVPSLLEESQKILKAQASRGVDFSYGNLKDKVKALVSLVVPMFSVAFNKADDLANAMEARSYNPRYTRTRYRSFTISKIDWLLFMFLAFVFGLCIALASAKMVFAPFGWIETLLIYG